MKPSLFVEYFYGIFRYRINGRSLTPIDFRMKIIAAIITSSWISMDYIIGIMPKVIVLLSEPLETWKVSHILPWIVAGIHIAVTNFTVIFFRAQDNQKVIEMFAKIDISLHASMNDRFYKTSRDECIKLIIIYVLFCISIITVSYSIDVFLDKTVIMYCLIYFARKIEIVLFCEMMFFLRQRLLLVRDYLIKFISDRNQPMGYISKKLMNSTKVDNGFNFIGRLSDRNNKIIDLASAFNNIGETFKIINNIYNIIILMN
ncbi:uncharacterized protein [Battus philenor]|uniref:uncharacterized protein n=1 Tax=Battus philenor TaxID=42288 RepID=UPI0035D05D2B